MRLNKEMVMNDLSRFDPPKPRPVVFNPPAFETLSLALIGRHQQVRHEAASGKAGLSPVPGSEWIDPVFFCQFAHRAMGGRNHD
jgi:hypothetical protein